METPGGPRFEKRIVIGGMPRSGTTLFRYILDASPTILAGPETGFFLRPFALQQAQAERVASRVNRALELGADVIADMIRSSTSSVEAFDRMMAAYRTRASLRKTAWAEKTPWNCSAYHWLRIEDPDLYIVSLIRDPRDVVTSVLDDKYHVSIQRSLETLRLVLAFEDRRHLIVRYEDMVSDPAQHFREVFGFLGLPFPAQTLERYRDPSVTRDPSKVRQPKVQAAISTEWIGRWPAPEHAARIQALMRHPLAPDMLERAGYASIKVADQR
jgi:hypothetical protein